MNLPSLQVGEKVARTCIVQGGMSVRIALHRLAAAVANEGGVGTIGGMGIPPSELRREIRAARALTQGVFGVNLMYAGYLFDRLLEVCIEERVDYVAIGAGFARGPFKRLHEVGIPGFCIISSVKAARIAAKTPGVTGIVVESGQAAGHLGPDDVNVSTWELFPEVHAALKAAGFPGPIIAAGGLLTREDLLRALALGADGIQMGTRFAMTEESSASPEMKAAWVAATGTVVTDWSPTGFASRRIEPHPPFEALPRTDTDEPFRCTNCLKHCQHRDERRSHCIWNALNNSQTGRVDRGLIFAGGRVGEITDIVTVADVFRRLTTPVAGEKPVEQLPVTVG